MIRIPIKILLFTLSLLAGNASMAQTLIIPVSQQQAKDTIELPQKHQTMSSVTEQFGPPQEKQLPTGNPPISRWQYPNFVVIFEHQHVVHTVKIHRPAQTENAVEAPRP